MSLFIQIRNKRIVTGIIIIIGLCLGFFVLETALNSNSNLLKGNSDIVGVIDGDKVHYKDFSDKVEDMVESYKMNTKQKSLDDNTLFSLRDQAWNQMVQDHINDQEFSSLGIAVPDDEMKDLFFGNDPYPQVRKSFTDPKTGQFNPMYVKQYISMLDKPIEGQPDPVERRAQWVNFEKAVKDERTDGKFKALLTGGLYIPKWEAEMEYADKEKRFDISYVKIPYTVVSDSAVKVSDGEMQAYLDAHKVQYKQEESRKIEYVIFPVKASPEDTAKAKKFVTDAYEHMVQNPNDTNFIKLNADNSLDKLYYSKDKVGKISQKAKDTLQTIAIGTVVAPYFEDGSYKTIKLVDRKTMPDSVKFSLIIISKGADSVKTKFKTDSIIAGLRSGADFADAAQKFSDDKNSGAKGGDQGYMGQGRTFKQLDDFLFFGGQVGEIKKLNMGSAYGIAKITEAPAPTVAFQFALVSRKVEASSATDKAVYEVANKFASTNGTAELFTKALATNPKLNKQVAESVKKNDYQLPGLATARELVKWTYTANKDDISSVFAMDQNYVVAHLVSVKTDGVQQLTPELRPQVEAEVRKEKKGAQIAAQLNASLSLNATLESIATKMGQEVKTAPGVTFATPFMPGLGFEPKLIGAISAMKPNQLSKPVLGANGVFVVKVTNVTDAKPIADYTPYKQQELQTLAQRFQYGLTESLKKTIKVEDDRYKFF
jgi:peptidyl-prolyl cis-trans isomerase D